MSTSTQSIEETDRQFFNRFSNPNLVDLQHPHTSHSVEATSYAGSTYAGDRAGGSVRRSISNSSGGSGGRSHSPPNRHNARALHKKKPSSRSSSAQMHATANAISAAVNASVFGEALRAVQANKDIGGGGGGGGSSRANDRFEEIASVGSAHSSRRSSARSEKSDRPRRSKRRSRRRSKRRSTRRSSGRAAGGDFFDFDKHTNGKDADDDRRSSSSHRSSHRSSVRSDDQPDFMKKFSESNDQRREKQSYFIELQQLAKSGIQLSRPYTMDDTLEDMQHEVYMHNIHADTETMVGFMKFVTQVGSTGLEMLNNKIGPIVDLDGWSKELTKDMSKFDRPFTRIYRRLFKRGSMNPYMELAYIVIGSLVVHVMRKKLGPIADMLPMFTAMMPTQSSRNVGAGAPNDGGGAGGGGGLFGGGSNQFAPGGGAVAGGMPTTPLSFSNVNNNVNRAANGGGGGGGSNPHVNSAASEPPLFGASARAPTSHVAGRPRTPLKRPPPSNITSLASAIGQSESNSGIPIFGPSVGGGNGATMVCEGDVCHL